MLVAQKSIEMNPLTKMLLEEKGKDVKPKMNPLTKMLLEEKGIEVKQEPEQLTTVPTE